MKKPVTVTITGAAGQIGYALAFRVASGQLLGHDQPVNLHLLEITPTLPALQGVVMELNDCAFPLLHGIVASDDPAVAFKDADYALLVGSRPRGPGMERNDLLQANGAIFTVQGKALNDHASRDVKVLVVGNPANTNCLIAMRNAPALKPEQFSAMTRLDHNRALSQLATKADARVADVKRMIIWGNHSSTQVPDLNHASVAGKPAMDAIIDARGASSAASAANAAIDHMRDWALGTAEGNWVSMAIPSRGWYGVAEGIIYSFPVTVKDGQVTVVEGLDNSAFVKERMRLSEQELLEERDAVADLI